jgi:tripartite motif-containing protein 71
LFYVNFFRFGRELAKSRSSHFLKSDDASNTNSSLASEDENLSSWARYLKNKYGGRKRNADAETSPTNNENNLNNNNVNNNRSNNTNSNLIVSYSGPRGQYLQKQSLLMTFGSRGSQPGLFTWPRGIAVGPDNNIVVADSSNHRVQIFNEVGQHRFSFGCYGNGDGEFDCLAGVAVNRIGQYIIADRYNHRIQIFDPLGHFLRAFGSQGTSDGKFSYPWGITTDALGFIYVCDKENHRIQVFQSD